MSISIAIVEDLDVVRNGLKDFISLSTDFLVIGAFKTGEEALQKLPEIRPDIVIMDINLPGMNGIECIRQVKDKSPGTQFMMFTVYENDDKVFEALKAGASGYLLKNTGLLQIAESVKELHEGGSPMSANIARKMVNLFRDTDKKTPFLDILSNREKEILQLLAKGLLYKEIAEQLNITTGTVRIHIHKIYEKLHVQNRTEAINKAFGK
ncbi:MAG TPA: response regulator transcription factor [Chitinophagaceae bacterium]|jgi:DNA-binding NarL/FixJ family response regulator|nr:response regulator transcription factor [Chitinophagaceae bacterium]